MEKNIYDLKRIFIEVIETILGAFIMAIAVSLFLVPNKISSGGISGIATIVYYLFNAPVGLTVFIINIPLFFFAIFKCGKGFFVKSIIGTISFSICIDILDKFEPLTHDIFLACIYGGIIMGIGTAILFKANSSTGGTDLISYVAKRINSNINISKTLVILDIIIVALNMIFLKEIEIGLYSAIAIYLMGKMIDILFEGIYFTKLIFIISDNTREIADEIGRILTRGSTGLYGKGMYTNEDKMILMCVVTRKDTGRVINIAKNIDENSFIIITNSREVFGLGFKKE